MLKIEQKCFNLISFEIGIAILQDWVNQFQNFQSMWVENTCGHILKASGFHNSCKWKFYVAKSSKIHLALFQDHMLTIVPVDFDVPDVGIGKGEADDTDLAELGGDGVEVSVSSWGLAIDPPVPSWGSNLSL